MFSSVSDIIKHYKEEQKMSRYENHADEWREEENQRKAERDAARRNYYTPGDPRYIAPEQEDEHE